VFRLVAVAEAISWAGLLVAMAFKYGLDMPLGVTVVGWVHGLVFTAYVVTSLLVCGPLRWKFSTLVLALIASVPPLASAVFERWAARRGHLDLGDPAEPTLWRRVSTGLRELN
jgi:integral membrane protein